MNGEIWKFLAGLGLFIYSMGQLEDILKQVSGRSLKLFIRRNTQHLFKAIAIGTVLTAIAQSSSVVSLIVLAFVEAGIITFRNALAVILGTNLGTTMTGWIVATLGFKFDILFFSLPVIAISTLAMFLLRKNKSLFRFFSVLFALGMLFLSLSFIKESADVLVNAFPMEQFKSYPLIVFVLLGFLLTTIIQSSSATMAIALTAIYSGILSFPTAAALVIGSEVGTTMKILFWGVQGSVEKKRVAWGNFYYNIFTSVFAFVFLRWLIYFIEHILHISDPLIGLVAFQTVINLFSIVIFLPFLSIFSEWLEKYIREETSEPLVFTTPKHPEYWTLASEALAKEARRLLDSTRHFIRNTLVSDSGKQQNILNNMRKMAQPADDPHLLYEKLKKTEGDLLVYYNQLQSKISAEQDNEELWNYMATIRQTINAAKAIIDIEHNLQEFGNSINDILHMQLQEISEDWIRFEAALDAADTRLPELLSTSLAFENEKKTQILNWLKSDLINELEASTLLNVYKEITSCKKYLAGAAAQISLQEPI